MNIIQIGANSGDDHVFDFVKKHEKDIKLLILVEPIDALIPALKQRYGFLGSVVYENIAIVDKESNQPLRFYYEKNSNYECSSLNKQHLLSLGAKPQNITETDVPVLTFGQLMDKHNLTELDHLYIDAEGYDYFIVKSIDFKKYKIKNLFFEIAHTDGARNMGKNTDDIRNHLRGLGYDVDGSNGPNLTATLK